VFLLFYVIDAIYLLIVNASHVTLLVSLTVLSVSGFDVEGQENPMVPYLNEVFKFLYKVRTLPFAPISVSIPCH
jgi:hypothetical protein